MESEKLIRLGQRCDGIGRRRRIALYCNYIGQEIAGDTVNTARRLQALTRTLGTPLVVADALISKIASAQRADAATLLGGALANRTEQSLRGRSGVVCF